MPGRSIRIFLVEGTPAGLRTAELGMSTIKALVAPRSLLGKLAERPESRRTGIYLLVGDDPAIPGRPKVYIGEGDVVLDRLKAHNNDESKDFFDRAYVFVSKDDNLTKAHVRWLEGRLVERVRQASRCTVANASSPEGGLLPEADLAEMGEFLDQSQLLLSSLGLAIFEPLPAPVPLATGAQGQPTPVFQVQGDGYRASARLIGGAFVVSEGSIARAIEADSLSDSAKALRATLREAEVLVQTEAGLRLVQEYEFSSPSQAAQVFCGFSVNGRQAWKTIEGISFADWEDTELANQEPRAAV